MQLHIGGDVENAFGHSIAVVKSETGVAAMYLTVDCTFKFRPVATDLSAGGSPATTNHHGAVDGQRALANQLVGVVGAVYQVPSTFLALRNVDGIGGTGILTQCSVLELNGLGRETATDTLYRACSNHKALKVGVGYIEFHPT